MSKPKEANNFIEKIINEDIKNNNYSRKIHTRFPPEPNGYLHLGHVKSILLNYGIAEKYDGIFNLRFDDTNPLKEDEEYINSIIEDVRWLCPNWDGKVYYASNYFNQTYSYALELINKGLAYVDELSADEIRDYRGTLKEPGKNSSYRDRPIEESIRLFGEMKDGQYEDGEMVLRAKIDMKNPNLNMRDPVIYRILHEEHHNTNDEWCIYPMYDFAHPIQDGIENITHSLCTLEFEDHRPLYEWILNNLDDFKEEPPKQIEFAKLYLSNTMMGKRYLKEMVEKDYVDGWDDPRMPTISGYRNRGYTPESLAKFCDEIGVSKAQSEVDISMLEHAIREDLKLSEHRTMAVLDPIKLIITNYPEDESEMVEAANNPKNKDLGKRMIPFGREVYIERDDFMIDPPNKYYRLFPGNEVRLRHAYFVKCYDYKIDESGKVSEIYCTYDPETKSGTGFKKRKVKSTIHWVYAEKSIDAEVSLFEYLMIDDDYNKENFLKKFNKNSKNVLKNCKLEKNMTEKELGERFQFLRHGYFILKEKCENLLRFNMIVSQKSSWKK